MLKKLPDSGYFFKSPQIMGILNVTPDSFSDGGRFFSIGKAVAAGIKLQEEGADIIDIGGESTRPGALSVSPEEEQARIIPVIKALATEKAVISVDTRHASTMFAALKAGASIINDVSALSYDPLSRKIVAEAGCPVVLMHSRGTPETMKELTDYPKGVTLTVKAELEVKIKEALAAGIKPEAIILDPGIGFAKNTAQNLELLRKTAVFAERGFPLLIGVSRKSFIGEICAEAKPDERDAASLAAALFALEKGAKIIRTHNVRITGQALRLKQALTG